MPRQAPQIFQNCEIINNSSAEYAQSKRGAHSQSSRYPRSGGSGIKIMVPRAEKSSCGIMQLYPSHSTARMHSTKSTRRKSTGRRAGD